MAGRAFAAYTNHPQGMEAGLEGVCYYDPPNLTFPFGAYIAVVDIDRGTGEVKVRRFLAIDDCGTVINPMIVEGQIHGGVNHGPGAPPFREDWCEPGGQQARGGRCGQPRPARRGEPRSGESPQASARA